MCNCCDNSESPVKRIDVSIPSGDFWRSGTGANLPDQNNDHTEEISHNGSIVVGGIVADPGKIATFFGDISVHGQIDPNSIVFSDAPVGTVTAYDSVTNNYYKIGVIGVQRPLVSMPITDVTNAVQIRKADGTTVVFDADTINRRIGINIVNPQADLDVNGAVIHRQINLTNFAANAVLGTAATTVNIASVINIPQTTAGITVTLPNPTQTQAGRLLLVENTGTTPITVDTTPVTNQKMSAFVWSGAAWIPLAASGGGGSTEDFWRSGTGVTKPDGTTDTTENIARPGNTGIGLTDPTTVAAALDVNGAEVLRSVNVPNLAANGVLGTAAATVDISSVLKLTQTTAGISMTIPAPTNAQAGRLCFVENTGSVQTFVNAQPIPAGTGIPFVWSGTAWIPLAGAAGLDFWRSGTGTSTPDSVTDTTENITHNGNVGIGLLDPTTVSATLDVDGAEVLRPVTLANFPANAPVGTAAATVNIASVLIIPQTTPNIDLTLPNPTNAQSGRVLSIVNTGTAQIQIAGVYVNPSQGASWVWAAGAWRLIGDQPDFLNVAASRNINIGDHLKTLLASTAITLTVPANLGYMIWRIRQSTAGGVITMAGGAGVTVVAPYGASTFGLAGSYMICELINNTLYVG